MTHVQSQHTPTRLYELLALLAQAQVRQEIAERMGNPQLFTQWLRGIGTLDCLFVGHFFTAKALAATELGLRMQLDTAAAIAPPRQLNPQPNPQPNQGEPT